MAKGSFTIEDYNKLIPTSGVQDSLLCILDELQVEIRDTDLKKYNGPRD